MKKGFRHSEETKKKLSLLKMGSKNPRFGKKPHNYGKKYPGKTNSGSFKKGHKPSPESVKKVADQLRGRKRPESVRKTLSVSKMGSKNPMYGKTGELHHNYGTHWSEESKRKNSESKKKWYANGGEPHNKGKTGVISDSTRNKIRIARSKQKFPYKDTRGEKILQQLCKNIGIEFQKHKNFNLGFQHHQVDIFIEPNICLEVDGDYTHANPRPYLRPHKSPKMESGHKPDDIINTKTAKSIWEKDRKITKALIQLDNQVLRFWESELDADPEKCIQIIKEARKQTSTKNS